MNDPRTRIWAPWSLGFATFLVYVLRLNPSLGGGDSGELITVASHGGVAHPPGYPLYVLLAHAFAWLPIKTVAWRINLFSAVSQAGAVGVLAAALLRGLGALWPAVVGAGLFAFLPVTFLYATHAEVFALNNLFVAALVWFAVTLSQTADLAQWKRLALLAVAVGAVGLCNHHTLAFVGLGLLLWIAATRRAAFAEGPWVLKACGVCLLGLLPYVYLPLAAVHPALSDWGDATTWDGFWTHVLRQEYGTFRLSVQGEQEHSEFWQRMGTYGARLLRDTAGVGGMALLGLALAWQRRDFKHWVWGVGAAYGASLGLFMALDTLSVRVPLQVGIQERFWLAPNLLLCALVAYGVHALGNRWLAPVLTVGVVVLALWRGTVWRPEDTLIYRAYGEALLLPMPKDALLITSGEKVHNPLHYLQEAEGLRPDVQAVDAELMQTSWYARVLRANAPQVVYPGLRRAVPGVVAGFTLRDFVVANLSKRPVLLCNDLVTPDHELLQTFETQVVGFCLRLLPKNAVKDDGWITASRDAIARLQPFANVAYDDTSWARDIQRSTLVAQRLFAGRLLNVAPQRADEAVLLTEAVRVLESVRAHEPTPDASTYRNLGIAYQRQLSVDPQAKDKMRQAWRTYLLLATSDDPALPQIRAAVSDATDAR